MKPEIHREVWEHFDRHLPDDANVASFLKIDLNFTEMGADAFIKQFRKTLEFAGVANGSVVSSGASNAAEDAPMSPNVATLESQAPGRTASPTRPPTNAPRGDRTHVSMFGGKAALTVEWTTPLTPEEWARMVKALEAMGHVSASAAQPEGDD